MRWALGISFGLAVIWLLNKLAAREDLSTRRHLEQVLRAHKKQERKVIPIRQGIALSAGQLRRRA